MVKNYSFIAIIIYYCVAQDFWVFFFVKSLNEEFLSLYLETGRVENDEKFCEFDSWKD